MRHMYATFYGSSEMADDTTTGKFEEPSDEENVVIDTTSTEPLRNAKIEEPEKKADEPADVEVEEPNPPRTTGGIFTSPRFGSAGSGGAELEPGPGPG